MSRILQRRIFWDAPPPGSDVVAWNIHVDAENVSDFIGLVDSGAWPAHTTVTEPEWLPGLNEDLADDEYQIAIVAVDAAGNLSDPHSPPIWQNVPLDVTPPDAPTGGGIVSGEESAVV